MSATELFKVICVTCQAKLSVRNAALIGQIVACPRCSSMVEVHPPKETADSKAAAIITAAVVAPAVVTPGVTPGVTPEPAPTTAAETTVEPTSPEVARTPPELSPVSETPQPGTATPLAAEAIAAAASVGKQKTIALAIGSFLVGAAAVTGVMLSRSDSAEEASNQTTGNAPPVVETTPIELAPEEITPVKSTPDEAVAIDVPVVETTPTPNLPIPPVTPVVATSVPPVDEISAEPTVSSTPKGPTPAEPTPKEVVAAAVSEPSKEVPLVARKFDPLDFDPENLTLDAINHPAVMPSEPTQEQGDAPTAKPEVAAEVAPTNLPLVRVAPQQSEATRLLEAEKQLALLVPGVQIDGLPLVDCLRLISQLSGVPVSISSEQLLMAGISPLQRVSIDASEISLGELLNKTLKPLRLVYETDGPQVVIKRKEAAKIREISYKVDDLIGDPTDIEQLATWVEQLVAPGTWESAGGTGTLDIGDGSLQITQSQQVQYQVLIFLERLRLTRNQPPKSRFPIKRLAGQPAQQAIAPQLATSTTFTFSQYTPLDEIFAHWQTELGMPLLIDWPALADENVWPSTQVACSIIDQPWSNALTRVLEPLGLDWRATHGNAVEITSLEKARSELQLEIYPLGQRSPDAVQELLGQLRARARRSANAGGRMLWDPVGNSLLSLQPATTQRVIMPQLSKQ